MNLPFPWVEARRRWGPVSRRGRWRQTRALRVVSAVLLGVAVWWGGSAVLPKPADPGVPTVLAAHDVALGTELTAEDVRIEPRPSGLRPSGALTQQEAAVGHVVSGPVLAGEIMTAARFRGPGQLAALPATSLAVSVPLSDTSLVGVLRPADVVSVLVAGSGQTVASAAAVLAVDTPASGVLGSGALGGAHLLLALGPEEARAVATALGPAGAGAGLVIAVHR